MRTPTVTPDKLTEILRDPHLRRIYAVELRDAWLTARGDALRAYAGWCAAPPAARGDAYAAYVAATDREGAAAAAWEACCRAAGQPCDPGGDGRRRGAGAGTWSPQIASRIDDQPGA